MPYASDKQRKFFHTATARAKGITPATVAEYDAASARTSTAKTPQQRAMHGLRRAAGMGSGKR